MGFTMEGIDRMLRKSLAARPPRSSFKLETKIEEYIEVEEELKVVGAEKRTLGLKKKKRRSRKGKNLGRQVCDGKNVTYNWIKCYLFFLLILKSRHFDTLTDNEMFSLIKSFLKKIN